MFHLMFYLPILLKFLACETAICLKTIFQVGNVEYFEKKSWVSQNSNLALYDSGSLFGHMNISLNYRF